MGKLIQLEIENFKSYRGHHIIGPFKDFTSIIGPNGSGKSNLMDAVSFVLGVNSAQLRSTQLKDLVYRGRAMLDESQYTENGDSIEPSQTNDAKSAQVTAVYEDDEQRELRFMRTVNVNGNSEYKLNGRTVTKQQYNARLEKENILVKARNFLVFQGDVEAIASQSSKDLTKLIEQVSGYVHSSYPLIKFQTWIVASL
ncbi:RecF/RecN/SMC N terminal domain-containing protein [Paraphysoderma sedebokerense]|nr:RecF/RecN/SMC N terminal domain-containing protein [Paraphysoderma sedebokerense]